MPKYKVKIWYTTYTITEVDAEDVLEAEDIALFRDADSVQVMRNLEALEFNNEVDIIKN
jgi:hypothetical protein